MNLRILPLKSKWFDPPALPSAKKVPGRRKRMQEVDPYESHRKILKPSLRFEPSRRWRNYIDLESETRGYLCELYNLAAIAQRYGLTSHTRTYWREHILPEPFTLSNAKSVNAYYWSRIQLAALDTVLRYHESQGLLTIRKTHHASLDMVQRGADFLEKYYAEQEDAREMAGTNRFGVRLL